MFIFAYLNLLRIQASEAKPAEAAGTSEAAGVGSGGAAAGVGLGEPEQITL